MNNQTTYDVHTHSKYPCEFIVKLYDMMNVRKNCKHRAKAWKNQFNGVMTEQSYTLKAVETSINVCFLFISGTTN
jgi:hypothetical protein